jgi:hypothetical protein
MLVQGVFPLILSSINVGSLADKWRKSPLEVWLRDCMESLLRWSHDVARPGPVMMSSLKWSHDVARDSSYSCLKFRTYFRRLTTLEMGKKRKQNLEHKVFQSPCILPMVWLYHYLALPIKENENNFHLKVLSDMPMICKHAQICSYSRRCEYGFSSPSPEKDHSWINFIKHKCNSY